MDRTTPTRRPTSPGLSSPVPRERPRASSADGTVRDRKDLGWLVLLPIACCGGPLAVAAVAAAGAAAWGGLGAGLVVIAVAAAFIVVRRRRAASCCTPSVSAGGSTPVGTDRLFARRAESPLRMTRRAP